jgi:hypothetical protein
MSSSQSNASQGSLFQQSHSASTSNVALLGSTPFGANSTPTIFGGSGTSSSQLQSSQGSLFQPPHSGSTSNFSLVGSNPLSAANSTRLGNEQWSFTVFPRLDFPAIALWIHF